MSIGPNWTEEEKEALRTQWLTMTATEIGKIVGRTRNAVIGMTSRMGLPPKKASGGKPQPKPKPASPDRVTPFVVKRRNKAIVEPQGRQESGVSILEAKYGQCREVIDLRGSPEGLALFCGQPTINGGPWCEYHRDINTDYWRGRR